LANQAAPAIRVSPPIARVELSAPVSAVCGCPWGSTVGWAAAFAANKERTMKRREVNFMSGVSLEDSGGIVN